MKMPMQIVALRTVQYSDSKSILTAYSRTAGRVSFLVPAGAGREASRRRALLMPLSIVECVADIRPGRDIHIMVEPRMLNPLQALRANPVKSSVALFVAEVLSAILRENQADAQLYDYIVRSIATLDALPPRSVANFHIAFLAGLCRFVGIEPDLTTFQSGYIFDMIDGIFRPTAPLHNHFLSPQDSAAVAAMGRMTYANMHLYTMTRSQRNELIDGILRYYSLHFGALSSIRSLDVLRVLF